MVMLGDVASVPIRQQMGFCCRLSSPLWVRMAGFSLYRRVHLYRRCGSSWYMERRPAALAVTRIDQE